MEDTPESHDPADNYVERMIDVADYLRDELKDRQMEEMWAANEERKAKQS
jgi:hypothetical protein